MTEPIRREYEYEGDPIDLTTVGRWAQAMLDPVELTVPPYVHTYRLTPPPLTLGDLAALVDGFDGRPRPTFRCHPDVLDALRAGLPPTDPAPPEQPVSVFGIPIDADDSMLPGAWQIRRGDEIEASGNVHTPPAYTIKFDAPEPFTGYLSILGEL